MVWRILLCSDGSPAAVAGTSMLEALGLREEAEIVILGVVEPGQAPEPLERGLAELQTRLAGADRTPQVRLRQGHAAEQILAEAESNTYDLVVVGAQGRRGLTRFRLGSTAGRLARHLRTSLLACRRVPETLERILVCASGEAPSLETLRSGAALAGRSGASITLLHVMSQVALTWESPSEDLADSAESAMARQTREGTYLRQGLQALSQAGLRTPPVARLRHGLVVDEVIAEIRQGGHQLLTIGSHRPSEASAAYAPYLDDIADRLLAHAPCSVLVVRATGL
ncbi:MAG TPA: universal stress protein [Anaerolineales bacterium]|nr:universal stress protein [Anaerolineales bacterium]